MSITARIFEICEMYDISDRRLSVEADLNEGYMNKTRTMDREIGSDKVEKLYHILNRLCNVKINPEWYLIGKGPKFISGYAINNEGKIVINEETPLNSFEYKMLSALDNTMIQDKLKELLSLK